MKLPTHKKKNPFRADRTIEALHENMQILTGQRGDKLFSAITKAQVSSLDLTTNKSLLLKNQFSSGETVVEAATKPLNVVGTGGFGSILVSWDSPTFKGFAYAEIWRYTDDELHNAILLGTTSATLFGDVVPLGSTFYYWIRFVNLNVIAGPYHSFSGVKVVTSRDIGKIIEDVEGELEKGALVGRLSSDIEGSKSAIDVVDVDLQGSKNAINDNIQAVKDTVDITDTIMAAQVSFADIAAKVLSVSETEVSSAKISAAKKTVADLKQAMAVTMAELETAYKSADSDTNSTVSSLAKTVSDADSALATSISELDTAYKSADSDTNSTVSSLAQTVSDADSALATSISELDTAYKSADSDTNSTVSSLAQTVSDADSALATSISELDTAYKSADSDTNSTVSSLAQTVSDADSALATSITELETAYKSADSDTNSTVSSLAQTVSDADSALATSITELETDYKSADSDTNSTVSSLAQTVSDADSALAESINTVSTKVNGEMTSAIETNSRAVANIKKDGSDAYQALWSVKAQAGDIKAGIGIIVDSATGESQVGISASQFFVFDPNNPGGFSAPFIIDNGVVQIKKALIEAATIQVLNAQEINADTVSAGIEITTPTINSAVINGAEINIGAGGSYNGHHFHVNSAGNLYAENAIIRGSVYADSGYFRGNITGANGTFSGRLEATDGYFSGTIYAEHIQGDVTSAIVKSANPAKLERTGTKTFLRVHVAANPRDRHIVLPTVDIEGRTSDRGSHIHGRARYIAGGKTIYGPIKSVGYNYASTSDYPSAVKYMAIPANWSGHCYIQLNVTERQDNSSREVSMSMFVSNNKAAVQLITKGTDLT